MNLQSVDFNKLKDESIKNNQINDDINKRL